MSVVINTNYSATLAANNLATSNASLQKSLNRLSSGSKIVSPADDAGGLAVSMKLAAASKRQGAVSQNIGNATSLLQTQDGALKITSKILDRISELKMLHSDATKNASDKANYNSEFTALQAQLTAIGSEKFNGIALFGSTDLTVAVTENGSASSTVTIKGVNLLGAGGGTPVSFNFSGSSDPAIIFTPSGAGTLTVTSGGIYIAKPDVSGEAWLDDSGDSATYDGAGGWTLSGANSTGGGPISGLSVQLQGSYDTSHIGSATFTPSGGGTPSNVGTVAAAADLGALSLSTVTSAIQDVATYRAQNGAEQSRLGFADELLTTNKANLEAANSRIIDVDVASESTQLARFNTLVQAGTSMLSQANQSAQMALKLLQ